MGLIDSIYEFIDVVTRHPAPEPQHRYPTRVNNAQYSVRIQAAHMPTPLLISSAISAQKRAYDLLGSEVGLMSSSTNKKDLWYSATTLKNGIRAAHEAGAYANELKRRNVKWSPWRGGTSEKWGVVREGFLRGRGRIEGGERGNNGLLGGVGGGAGRARTFAEGMMERGERGEVWEPDDELSTIIPPRRRITAPPTVNEPQRLMIEPGTVQMPPPPMYNPREYAVNPQETRQNVQKKQVYQAQDYGGSGVEERYGGKGMEDRYIGTSGGVRKLPPSKEVRMWLDSQNAKPKEYQGTRRKERSRGRSRGRRRSRVGYRS